MGDRVPTLETGGVHHGRNPLSDHETPRVELPQCLTRSTSHQPFRRRSLPLQFLHLLRFPAFVNLQTCQDSSRNPMKSTLVRGNVSCMVSSRRFEHIGHATIRIEGPSAWEGGGRGVLTIGLLLGQACTSTVKCARHRRSAVLVPSVREVNIFISLPTSFSLAARCAVAPLVNPSAPDPFCRRPSPSST